MFTILIIIFAAAFAALAWTNLRAACFFVLALLPTYLIRFTVGPVPTTVLELMLVLIILIWLTKYQGYKKLNRNYLIPITLFLVASTVSVFVAPDTVAALGIWKAYFIEPILFFFVLSSVLEYRSDAHRAVLALGAGMFFVALIAVIQKMTGLAIPEPWDLARRVTSVFAYPNAVGLYLAPLIVLGVVLWTRAVRKSYFFLTYFWTFALILSTLAIIFSETEAAWVAIPAALWIVSWLVFHTRWWTLPLGVVAIIIILTIPILRGPVLEKITLQDYSGTVRTAQWSETIEFIKDEPLLGAGLSGYPTAIEPYHQNEHIEIFQYPHNIFLNTWVELGLIGLIGLIGLMIAVLKKTAQGLRAPKPYTWLVLGCFGALLCMAIHGLVDAPYLKNDLAIMTWSLLAILAFAAKRPYEI